MIKYLHFIGLAACLALVVSCFIDWTYYADLHEAFTGFFSEQNQYGKPGIFLVPLAIIVMLLTILPKVWAKRTNLFICALLVGYAVKTFVLFTSCYNAYCPEKRFGIYLMLVSVFIMLLAAVFPDMKMGNAEK